MFLATMIILVASPINELEYRARKAVGLKDDVKLPEIVKKTIRVGSNWADCMHCRITGHNSVLST